MNPESGRTEPVWMSVDVPEFEPLSESASADVCVIGAGIAGLSCAYLLAKQGKSVIVLDDGPMCGGETQRTTAHLSNEIDDRYFEIERMHGKEKAKLAWNSHTLAIDMIEQLARNEKIECDFERLDGYLFCPDDKNDILIKEFEAATRAGFKDLEQLPNLPLSTEKQIPCLRFPRQAQFHVLKYLVGVANAAKAMGVRIFANTHVTKVEADDTVVVATALETRVLARSAIVASNSPIHGSSEFTKQAAYRSYVIGCRVAKGSVTRALYWDTEDPYHYVRLQACDRDPDHEILIVGGEDHKAGQDKHPEKRFDNLEKWARDLFPMIERVDFRWSGQVYEPVDALAFIGKDPGGKKNVYIATGDSGMGMTHGSIAAMLLTDLISGRENPWMELYDPSRKVFAAPVEFVKENFNTGLQYARNILANDVHSVDQIKPGEGAIISRNGEKIAVYRNDEGALQERSAVCPHMGAIVCWNTIEKSWDCPAHGSRFDAAGSVIDGPANSELRPCKNCAHGKSECADAKSGTELPAPKQKKRSA